MRIIDRILEFVYHHRLSPYAFERKCGLANGYLKKQAKSKKGTIGSETIEKITAQYKDLSLIWLLTGKGNMIVDKYSPSDEPDHSIEEPAVPYSSDKYIITLLKEKITILENSLTDKEKIIVMLEERLKKE